MTPEQIRLLEQYIHDFQKGTEILIPDQPTPIERENFGMAVRVRLDRAALLKTFSASDVKKIDLEITYHNVTEIHYKYDTIGPQPRIAFESDIHSTGRTWRVAEVAEFEATLETGIVNE